MVVEPVIDLVVNVGAHVFEAQVFQVALHHVQAQAVGQGRVDVHGFLGNALLLVAFLKVERAHVVQAVGQLDHKNPHVVAHGQDHFADVLCLGFFLVFKSDLADLGDAVHNVGYFFAKIFVQLFNGGLGVFHRIVQQPGRDGGLVKTHLSQNAGHSQRVGKVRFARKAGLPRVGGGRKHIRLLDEFQIGIGIAGRNLIENFLNTNHA